MMCSDQHRLAFRERVRWFPAGEPLYYGGALRPNSHYSVLYLCFSSSLNRYPSLVLLPSKTTPPVLLPAWSVLNARSCSCLQVQQPRFISPDAILKWIDRTAQEIPAEKTKPIKEYFNGITTTALLQNGYFNIIQLLGVVVIKAQIYFHHSFSTTFVSTYMKLFNSIRAQYLFLEQGIFQFYRFLIIS